MNHCYLLVNTMGSGDNPSFIDEGPSTANFLVKILPFDNSRLPRNFAEFDISSTNNFGRPGIYFAALY